MPWASVALENARSASTSCSSDLAEALCEPFVAGPLEDPTLGESYVYRHALLRDAAYATLSRRDRAVLHLRLADCLATAEPAAENAARSPPARA